MVTFNFETRKMALLSIKTNEQFGHLKFRYNVANNAGFFNGGKKKPSTDLLQTL